MTGKRSTGYFAVDAIDGTRLTDSANIKTNCVRLTARTHNLTSKQERRFLPAQPGPGLHAEDKMKSDSKDNSQSLKPETPTPPIEKGLLPLVVAALITGTILGWWYQTQPVQQPTTQRNIQSPFRTAFKKNENQSQKIAFPNKIGSKTNLFNLVNLSLPEKWTIIDSNDPTSLIATLTMTQKPGPVLMIRILPTDSFDEGWAILTKTESGTTLLRSPIQLISTDLQASWTDLKCQFISPSALPNQNGTASILQRRQYVLRKLSANHQNFLVAYISIATEITEANAPLTIQQLIEISRNTEVIANNPPYQSSNP